LVVPPCRHCCLRVPHHVLPLPPLPPLSTPSSSP
jgi:hypothetical protein